MTIRESVSITEKKLKEAGIADSSVEAILLASFVFGKDRLHLLICGNDPASSAALEKLTSLTEERINGRPVQYILGTASFMGLEFSVDERVLIPRPETEELAELVIERVKSFPDGSCRVLDLCTGSGAIGISVAALTGSRVVLTDLSKDALSVARTNARSLCPDNMPEFYEGDLFEALSGQDGLLFDIITSNPPYIAPEVIRTLQREVRDHEPVMALDGGRDGLELIERILQGASGHLENGGLLLMEIGYDQGPAAERLALRNGLSDVKILKDLNGLDRILSAGKK